MSFKNRNNNKRIALVGGGPSSLFMYKRLLESGHADITIEIFERKNQLGTGMPYSKEGSSYEHVTNVSDNEIPAMVTSIAEWVKTLPEDVLRRFGIEPHAFNEYKVLPRLFFGEYLKAQFDLLFIKAKAAGITTNVHYGSNVCDVTDIATHNEVWLEVEGKGVFKFTHVIICTGHTWPSKHEGVVPGYYDSPYPPQKLNLKLNHPIAIRGSSLTAVDAIRTLARNNGTFEKHDDGMLTFKLNEDSPAFKIVIHSRGGFLPAVRFHLEDSHLSKDSLLKEDAILAHMANNQGFLSLDFIFEKDFKETIRNKDAEFYEQIKEVGMEEFVSSIMQLREEVEPFKLLRAEYEQAEKSIKRKKSIYWKEALAILSFAMNYPAKHFSAEDMLRLHETLMPLISIVIAFLPQNSCRELLAMHEAGVLDIVAVGDDSVVEVEKGGQGITYHYNSNSGKPTSIHFSVFIDCTGQPHLSYLQFPFKSLLKDKVISQARIKFKTPEAGIKAAQTGNGDVEQLNGEWYLNLPGISINDNFQTTDFYGAANSRIFMMAVPYIAGFNPDYSGLDFCEAASARIIKALFND